MNSQTNLSYAIRGVSGFLRVGGQVVLGGNNVSPLVEIGLTDLPKSGWAIAPPPYTYAPGYGSKNNLGKKLKSISDLDQGHMYVVVKQRLMVVRSCYKRFERTCVRFGYDYGMW